jgi:hypothetical protein
MLVICAWWSSTCKASQYKACCKDVNNNSKLSTTDSKTDASTIYELHVPNRLIARVESLSTFPVGYVRWKTPEFVCRI